MSDLEPWLEAEEVEFRLKRCRGLRLAACSAVVSTIAYGALSFALNEPGLLGWFLFAGGLVLVVLLVLVGSFLADARRETLLVGASISPALGLIAVLLPLPMWLDRGLDLTDQGRLIAWSITLLATVGFQTNLIWRLFRELRMMPPAELVDANREITEWVAGPGANPRARRRAAVKTPQRPLAVSFADRVLASVLGVLLMAALAVALIYTVAFGRSNMPWMAGCWSLFMGLSASVVAGMWQPWPAWRLLAAGMTFWFGFTAFLSMPLLLLGATAAFGDKQVCGGLGLLLASALSGWLGLKTIRVTIDVIEGTVRGDFDARRLAARQAAAATKAADAEADALLGAKATNWDQADGATDGNPRDGSDRP